ncbi:hypothetical protein EMCRGX_G027227 [Ephydatia muelleri]
MNDAPVLVNEKFHVTSKWPFSERHYKMEYKPLSEEGEQIDARDVAHVHTKRSSRGKRFGGLSPRSWSKSQLAVLGFVIAAAVQTSLFSSPSPQSHLLYIMVIAVVTMQVLIIVNGGHGGRLMELKSCLSDSLQMAIDCSEKANWSNMTIPSFGKDKPVYVGFIIALTVYNAMLCFYALYGKHFLEIIAFLIVNILTTLYASFEVWQFRPFGPNCTEWPVAGQLAIASVAVLFVFTAVFVPLALYMYRDFGWKVYKDVNCNHQMRKYYQWYEAISSGVKLLILFTVVFSVAQLTLLLTPDNYEFELTIILVVVAVVAYFVLQLTIHYNSFAGYLVIACTGLLLFCYYAFKVIRFATQSCPICFKLKNSLNAEYKSLQFLLETCTKTSNATLNSESDRSIQFQNLVIFASVNFITTIIVFVIYFGFWCHQPGDKLVDHFKNNPSMMVRVMCYGRGKETLHEQIKKATGTIFGCSVEKPRCHPLEFDECSSSNSSV